MLSHLRRVARHPRKEKGKRGPLAKVAAGLQQAAEPTAADKAPKTERHRGDRMGGGKAWKRGMTETHMHTGREEGEEAEAAGGAIACCVARCRSKLKE